MIEQVTFTFEQVAYNLHHMDAYELQALLEDIVEAINRELQQSAQVANISYLSYLSYLCGIRQLVTAFKRWVG
jgi:hypothetical protein